MKKREKWKKKKEQRMATLQKNVDRFTGLWGIMKGYYIEWAGISGQKKDCGEGKTEEIRPDKRCKENTSMNSYLRIPYHQQINDFLQKWA